MSFIDGSYLRGEILIPNLDFKPTDGNTYSDDILQAIDQYETEILKSLLGYDLWKLLIADLDAGGNPQAARFTNLVDGAEFTNTYNFTKTLKWNGIRNTEKLSFSAYYMFFKYVDRNHSKLSGVGNVKLKAENAERVSPVIKTTKAWSDMLDLYGRIPSQYEDFYVNPIQGSNLPCEFNGLSSAYNFLYANKSTYPEWIFTPQWDALEF